MILVDTSIWVELLSGRLGYRPSPDDLMRFATCGPIVQEILQGIDEDTAYFDVKDSLLALPVLDDPLSAEVYVEAAEIFRLGRRKGYTIRSSIDCLIAAIAIRNHVPVWHRDRDFTVIARFTGLRSTEKP